MSHIQLAHQYWAEHLKPGDTAIDATCGNGKDTLKLAELVGPAGKVIGLDIQETALKRTQARLEGALPNDCKNIFLFLQSHADFPAAAYETSPRLIVYNLGYLPGGDKSKTTLTETTLESLKKSLTLLSPHGMISLTCYPGHSEGAREQERLKEFIYKLNLLQWEIHTHTHPTKPHAPSLHILKKLF